MEAGAADRAALECAGGGRRRACSLGGRSGKTKTVSLKAIVVEGYETGTIVIKSGLQPGDLVVTEGGKLLQPRPDRDLRGGGPS